MTTKPVPGRGPLTVTARSDHVDWLAREAAKVGVTISHFLERLIAEAIVRRESPLKESRGP
jgi:hypothetical protein